jgi:hypothetical protein
VRTVAALYVDPRGPYPSMLGVDCWDEARDARNYAGPHPVVAHPPCGRWCRLAKFCEARHGLRVGDDGGCFRSALDSVMAWGGILEHPAFTLAWRAHGLIAPKPGAGWQRTTGGYWVADVVQAAWGHVATKQTWLLFRGDAPPAGTRWERPKGSMVIGHYTRQADGTIYRRSQDRIHDKRAIHTPPRFAEFLVEAARGSGSRSNTAA